MHAPVECPASSAHFNKIHDEMQVGFVGRLLYISYRGTTGKTTGYYVPRALEAQIRQGVDAWSQLQDCLRELAALNKERLIPVKAKK
jgi:hypothetical protein